MTNTILITGASSGLGKATAKLFQQRGWNVIATMRAPEKEQELTQLPNVALLALDVTKPGQIGECVKQATSLAKIDVVFNNAGHGLFGPLEGYSDDQITGLINTNLTGIIRMTKAFTPYFREQGGGLFIATSSLGGVSTFPFSSMYHATKWALEGFSESMSFELSRFNIGIKTIVPAGIRTDYIGRSMGYGQENQDAYQAVLAQADKLMGQLIRPENLAPPEEIAEVVYEAATDGKNQVRYIASEQARQSIAHRNEVGAEAFRQEIDQLFFGSK